MNKSALRAFVKRNVIPIFIISMPIIDLITSLDERLDFITIPIGSIIKFIFLAIAIIYAATFSTKKWRLALLSVFFLYLIHAIINNIFSSGSVFFDDLKMFSKYWSLLFFSIFAITYCKRNNPDKTTLLTSASISLIIYSFFIIFPTLIDASFSSYHYSQVGSVGWYYAANEIGPVIILLVIFTNYAMALLKPRPLYIISSVLGIISVSLLGTKTALFSLLLFLIVQLVLFIIKRDKKLSIINIAFLLLTILSAFLFSNASSSMLQLFDKTLNTQQASSIEVPKEIIAIQTVLASDNENPFFDKIDTIMSHRLTKTVKIFEENQDVTIPQILFGKTYYYLDSEIITAEIDYIDFALHFGILGTILFFYAIAYLITSAHLTNRNKTNSLYFLTIWLLFAFVAGLAGHIITSPSVCIFLSLSFLVFYKTPVLNHK